MDTSWLFEPTTGVHHFGGGSIVHRRMSADEIEVARLDALAERELGP
jgi:hypothetical protein